MKAYISKKGKPVKETKDGEALEEPEGWRLSGSPGHSHSAPWNSFSGSHAAQLPASNAGRVQVMRLPVSIFSLSLPLHIFVRI